MIINLKSDDYYTQRNNKIEKYEACMPTSRVMFYTGNKIKYMSDPTGEWADDDYFIDTLLTIEGKQFCKDNYKTNVPPNQVHAMYSGYLDKIVCGKVVSKFRQDLFFDDIVQYMKAGKVIMTSGQFQGQTSLIPGHAFCFVGLDDNECLLMADPYGNWHTNYSDPKGYLVPMSKKEFLEHCKPLGSDVKWGHVPLEV